MEAIVGKVSTILWGWVNYSTIGIAAGAWKKCEHMWSSGYAHSCAKGVGRRATKGYHEDLNHVLYSRYGLYKVPRPPDGRKLMP